VAEPKRVETHLSRSEVMTLLFDKLSIISGECSEYVHDGDIAARNLPDLKLRLRRIALEAKRAASLIETYEHAAKAGHCLHCGKTYEEHDDKLAQPLPEGSPRVRAKGATSDEPQRCRALRAYFESVEVETYKPLQLQEVDLG
jgi:hypothetical protein